MLRKTIFNLLANAMLCAWPLKLLGFQILTLLAASMVAGRAAAWRDRLARGRSVDGFAAGGRRLARRGERSIAWRLARGLAERLARGAKLERRRWMEPRLGSRLWRGVRGDKIR